MPSNSASVKNEKQYEALKDTGMSKIGQFASRRFVS